MVLTGSAGVANNGPDGEIRCGRRGQDRRVTDWKRRVGRGKAGMAF